MVVLASEILSLFVLLLLAIVMVEFPRFSYVLNYVPMLVIKVPLLLFLKIYFICLNVSQEFERFAYSSFFFELSFSRENMLRIMEKPLASECPFSFSLSAWKKGWAKICSNVNLSS